MEPLEWVNLLEPDEQPYARQCWHFHQGTNGGIRPANPPGMSQARADCLFFHMKSVNNGERGHRKMEESKPRSIRMTDKLYKELAFEAAELGEDISWSKYVERCINAGRPIVRAFPDNEFKKPCITNVVERGRN